MDPPHQSFSLAHEARGTRPPPPLPQPLEERLRFSASVGSSPKEKRPFLPARGAHGGLAWLGSTQAPTASSLIICKGLPSAGKWGSGMSKGPGPPNALAGLGKSRLLSNRSKSSSRTRPGDRLPLSPAKCTFPSCCHLGRPHSCMTLLSRARGKAGLGVANGTFSSASSSSSSSYSSSPLFRPRLL